VCVKKKLPVASFLAPGVIGDNEPKESVPARPPFLAPKYKKYQPEKGWFFFVYKNILMGVERVR